MTDRTILTVEVALDLKQPLENLAGSLQRSPDWIVNRALEEYLDRIRPDHDPLAAGSQASYLELTAREGQFDFL